MSDSEIIERNKQIALMLGAIYSEVAEAWGFGNAKIEDKEITIHGKPHKNLVWAERWEKELKFHSDWNWLKESLNFINSLNEEDFSDDEIHAYDDILDLTLFSDIIEVFERVSIFAKLYNEKKI